MNAKTSSRFNILLAGIILAVTPGLNAQTDDWPADMPLWQCAPATYVSQIAEGDSSPDPYQPNTPQPYTPNSAASASSEFHRPAAVANNAAAPVPAIPADTSASDRNAM